MIPGSAWEIALRPAGRLEPYGSSAERRLAFAAGLRGVLLGPIVCVVGALLGTLLMNRITAAAAGPGETTVLLPWLVVVTVFGPAFYGGLVLVVGTIRILETRFEQLAPPRRGWPRVLVLTLATLEGFALLFGVFLLVHALGVADFLLG